MEIVPVILQRPTLQYLSLSTVLTEVVLLTHRTHQITNGSSYLHLFQPVTIDLFCFVFRGTACVVRHGRRECCDVAAVADGVFSVS